MLLIWQNIFREEYLVCEFACLLSSVGGYVGLFFGASFFDLIFLFEFIVKYLNSISRRKNKRWNKKITLNLAQSIGIN